MRMVISTLVFPSRTFPIIDSKGDLEKRIEIDREGFCVHLRYVTVVRKLLKSPLAPSLGRRCRFLSMGDKGRKKTDQYDSWRIFSLLFQVFLLPFPFSIRFSINRKQLSL